MNYLTPHTYHRTPHTAHRTPHTARRTPHTSIQLSYLKLKATAQVKNKNQGE